MHALPWLPNALEVSTRIRTQLPPPPMPRWTLPLLQCVLTQHVLSCAPSHCPAPTTDCCCPVLFHRERYGGGFRLNLSLSRDGDVALGAAARAAASLAGPEDDGGGAGGTEYERERRVEEAAARVLRDAAVAFVRREVCEAAKPLPQFCHAGAVSLTLPKGAFSVSTVFETLERRKAAVGIVDWSLHHSSLEEVFVRIAQEAEDEDADIVAY